MMERLLKYIITIVILTGYHIAIAQQLPVSNQYMVNPYALSPTFAGYTGYSEAFINYRNDWGRIDGNPRTFSAMGYGNAYKEKMWVGGEIVIDKADILSLFKANLSWTYKLQVENNQFLYFGVWTTLFQATANTSSGIGIDPNDPIIQNSGKLNSSAFNAGIGINYNWDKLIIGISIPTLFGFNDEYEQNSSFKYKVQRQFQVHTSYLFNLNKEWDLQTYGVYRKTANQPGTIEISAMAIYMGRFWGGMLFRNGGVLAINAGGHIYNGFVFNYSYEIGLGKITKGSGGSHEITIGYRFKFTNDNYFISKDNTSGSRSRKGRRSGTLNYPEVKDFNYKRN
jgi:type IX secretion system PorP/SprF family membrane protein